MNKDNDELEEPWWAFTDDDPYQRDCPECLGTGLDDDDAPCPWCFGDGVL